MRGRAGVVVAALALLGVLALAVFPAKAWLDQRHTRNALAAQLATLSAENGALDARVAQLHSDAEIERLARQYNLVKPGEEIYFILPQAGAPPATARAPEPAPKRSPSVWERFTSLF